MPYQEMVTAVLETAVTIVVPVIGAYAIKWLNAHIGEKRTNVILSEVRTVVNSVQQLADSGKIDKSNKYFMAFDYIAKHYNDLPEDKINHLIESAVKDMKGWGTPLVGLSTIPETPAVTVNSDTTPTPVITSNATI